MMGDLISRSRLMDSLHREVTRLIGGDHYVRLSAVQEKIRIVPTVDAVEVVRCRDCKHHRNGACPMRSLHVAPRGYGIQDNTVDDGFCNMGAKMDGGVVDV